MDRLSIVWLCSVVMIRPPQIFSIVSFENEGFLRPSSPNPHGIRAVRNVENIILTLIVSPHVFHFHNVIVKVV